MKKASAETPSFLKRWAVIGLMIGGMAGGYILLYLLSPLQSLLQQSQGWSVEVYGRYSAAESFLNVFCGILLIAGILVDRLGATRCGILSGLLMMLGGAFNYLAFTDFFLSSSLAQWLAGMFNFPSSAWNLTPFSSQMPPSAKLATMGFMVFGVGMEMAGVSASKASVSWFRGKELALALGVQLAGSRIIVAMALWFSPRLAFLNGHTSICRPLGWGLLILMISLCCWIAFGVINRNKRECDTNPGASISGSLKSLCRNTASNRALWLLAVICVTYYSAAIPFFRYATAMFESSLGMQASSAANLIALLPMASALATPFFCLIPDHKGGGIWLLSIGAGCMAVCYLLFALVLPATHNIAVAYTGILLLGLASSMASAGLWPLVPKLVSDNALGSAYAALYWVQGVGLYITPLLAADAISRSSSTGFNAYTPAMILFASIAGIALLTTLILASVNRGQNMGLNLPNYSIKNR